MYTVVDPLAFTDSGLLRVQEFLDRVAEHDWSAYSGKKVLVRGCSTIVPPWAYMILTSRLSLFAKSIRFGNEHDNLLIHRN